MKNNFAVIPQAAITEVTVHSAPDFVQIQFITGSKLIIGEGKTIFVTADGTTYEHDGTEDFIKLVGQSLSKAAEKDLDLN